MGILKNKLIRISILLVTGVSCSVAAFAQDDNQDQMTAATQKIDNNAFFPFSAELGGNLWYPLSNFALLNNFGGVYFAHGSFQYALSRNIYAGIELQSGQVSEVTPITYRVAIATTNLFAYDAGLKVSYFSSETSDWFFSASVSGGIAWLTYNKLPANATPPSGGFDKKVFFLNPRISESLRVNDELRIGIEMTYTYYNYTFDPVSVGITTRQYTESQTSSHTTMLGWGFILTYFVGKAKS